MSTVEHPPSGEPPLDPGRSAESAPAGLAAYRLVLGLPGVRSLLTVACIARFPPTATLIALTLHAVVNLDRSYYEAGVVAALYITGRAIGSPLMGLLLDRRGLHTMLAVTTGAQLLVWTALPRFTFPVLLVGVFTIGVLALPVSSLVRQAIGVIVPSRHQRPAFAVDAIAVDVVHIIGPAVGTLLILQLAPGIALRLIGICWGAAGFALWRLNPPMRVGTATAVRTGRRRIAHWLTPGLGAVFLSASTRAFLVYSTELSLIAGLQSAGQADYLTIVYAAWCVAAVAGGLGYGTVPRHPGLFTLIAALAMTTFPLGLATHWWVYLILLVPAGLFSAPPIASGSQRLSELAPDDSRGVISGLYDSSIAIGAGVAAPLAGLLIDGTSPQVAISVIAVCGFVLAGAGSVLARQSR
ncbi:MFS transporter [Nocardia sp. NPDC049149]|uniref:MFS transporter n=1 Tax=Nocardia sp. NPDC049149 TaxID=3364315 RepID=UPI003723901A